MSRALDERDLAILRILSREGRISKTEIARRVNLSPTPCWERIRKLEACGLIRGYRAEIALEALGPVVTAFVMVELETHRSGDFRAFEAAVAKHDDVVGCWALGGGFDYLMKCVAKDIDSYQRMIDGLLREDIGLKRYFTYIVTDTVKDAGLPPEDVLYALQKK